MIGKLPISNEKICHDFNECSISMSAAYRRHDISDEVWTLLEPHLPGRAGVWGGKARDNRQFINAVFWILRTGAPWRDLPPS
jgi:hypothetical protein